MFKIEHLQLFPIIRSCQFSVTVITNLSHIVLPTIEDQKKMYNNSIGIPFYVDAL